MTNSQRLARVRERLLSWLDQQSLDGTATAEASTIINESVLIVDGFYCGRRFNAGTYQATWFIEEDELKIQDESGNLLCVIAGSELNSTAQSTAQTPGQAPVDRTAGQDIIAMPSRGQDAVSKDDDDEIRRAA